MHKFVLGCLLSVGLWSAENPAARFRSLEPGTTLKVDQTFACGNATVALTGRAVPLRSGGKVRGFFFQGSGSLSLLSTFAPEAPILKRNLQDWTQIAAKPTAKGLEIAFPFEQARVLFAGIAGPVLDGAPAEPLAAELKAHQEKFNLLQGFEHAQLLALQEANGGTRPLLVIELKDGDRTWVYQYDGVSSRQETLHWCRPDQSQVKAMKGFLHPYLISRQAIGWDPRKGSAPPPFQIRALDVDLRTRDNRNAECVVKETIVPLEPGTRALRFGLFDEIITEKDVRKLRVARVTDAEGRNLGFDHAKDFLLVDLGAPATGPVTLTFAYAGDYLVQPGEDSYWQLDVRGSWYPECDNLSGELYTYHAVVRTAGEWHGFTPGETVRRGKDGEWNLAETRTDKPICFATILGGKYYTDEETRDGLTVRIATYAFKPGVANKVFRDQAFNIIRYYQNFLGPFPFKELQIVEKNAWGYGQAPPGMMYITRDAFEQAQVINQMGEMAYMLNELEKRGAQIPKGISFSNMDVRHVMAHELAHQYWGTVVKMPSAEDQWITESFADYCAALYDGDFKNKGLYQKAVNTWFSYGREASAKAPIPLANQVAFKDARDRWLTRTYLLYNKGPALLAALHKELGDAQFFTFMKSLQTNFRWKFLPTSRIPEFLKFMTKKDYGWFFERYFWGTEMPDSK